MKIELIKYISASMLLLSLFGCGLDVQERLGNIDDANKVKVIIGADFESRLYVNNKMVAQGYYLGFHKSERSYYVYFLNWTPYTCNQYDVIKFDEEISTLTVDRIYKGKFHIEKKILGNPGNLKVQAFRDNAEDFMSKTPKFLPYCE